MESIASAIRQYALEVLGFESLGFSGLLLPGQVAQQTQAWLDEGCAGEMHYLHQNKDLRDNPEKLLPQSKTLISARLAYWPQTQDNEEHILTDGAKAYVSRYALGRDYHKIFRKKLNQLADFIRVNYDKNLISRPFSDSAPIYERHYAQQAGLGFIGKNTLLIHPQGGSLVFLGELLMSFALPADAPTTKQGCGPCTACLDLCPTQALTPFKLDARRCISYLTIEYHGIIAEDLALAMGNRIYGCDDCQLVCPWNKFASKSHLADFQPRHQLHDIDLLALWQWNEEDFLHKFAGSPIRRIGYATWVRNLAIALGNSGLGALAIGALSRKSRHNLSPAAQHHIDQAIQRLRQNPAQPPNPPLTSAKIFYPR